MPTLAINKRARYDYEISDTFEAGIVLYGYEVKSIKTGQISLKGAFVTIKQGELFLTNSHVPLYKKASTITDYDPDRPRKLLVKSAEIKRLIGKKQEQGLTFVPLKLYTKRSLIKLKFALARGKKKHDKREAIKKRDVDRKIRSLTKERYE
ncbi:SsrA-binding protein SmpB [Candidatus Parcubacteria bacterium]|nr:SsrA-binding protein SmpB [Candidatus Parcubacteria bacterium]